MVSEVVSTPDATEAFSSQLHVETSGPEGSPPVLLHGWGSSAELMRGAGAALEDTRRVYNLNLPGHGKTPPPPEPWGVPEGAPEYAALVAHFIREHGLAPLPVIGHSNGGRIALFMASDERYAGPATLVLPPPASAPAGSRRSRRCSPSSPLREGLDAEGYPSDCVKVVHSLFEAQDLLKPLLRESDVVLYENDLPDHYDEAKS